MRSGDRVDFHHFRILALTPELIMSTKWYHLSQFLRSEFNSSEGESESEFGERCDYLRRGSDDERVERHRSFDLKKSTRPGS